MQTSKYLDKHGKGKVEERRQEAAGKWSMIRVNVAEKRLLHFLYCISGKKITTFAAAATFQANYCLDLQKFILNAIVKP